MNYYCSSFTYGRIIDYQKLSKEIEEKMIPPLIELENSKLCVLMPSE